MINHSSVTPLAAPRSLMPGVQDLSCDPQLRSELSSPSTLTGEPMYAEQISQFAQSTRLEDIPEDVRERAKDLWLDSIGIAIASSRQDFAKISIDALRSLSEESGSATVIGSSDKLPLRDAVHVNGVLIHGLDFDDTHTESLAHTSCTILPVVLALSELGNLAGDEALVSHVLGVEVATRIGLAAERGFHENGHHSTAICGAFGAAVAASRLRGLSGPQMTMAQGIVGSMAAGSLEFLEEGAWVKRSHAGWAGVSAVTAAALAQNGFTGPRTVYEGRYGILSSHARANQEARRDRLDRIPELGKSWELMNVGIKPYPACLFTHAFADAALALRRGESFRIEDIQRIICPSSELGVQMVFEPLAEKKMPTTAYAAQFSVPYIVAAALARSEFGIKELEADALSDEAILNLAKKVSYTADPDTAFPKAFSGEVIIELANGKTIRHREQLNRGCAARPLTRADIIDKFFGNTDGLISQERANEIMESVLQIDRLPSLNTLMSLLRC